MTKRILIAGCGDIGTAVGAALCADGHQVVGLRRACMAADETGIAYLQADLTRPETLRGLDTRFDQVLVIVTPNDRSAAGYEEIYLNGVGHLLQHFSAHNAKVPVMYVSSTRVYGQRQGEWVDEDSETQPVDDCGRILLAAEQQVLAHNERNSIVRFSGIYGRAAQYLLKLAQQGQPVQHTPPSYTNRVHRADCVGVLTFLVQKQLAGVPLASHYLVSDDEPAPQWEVVAWLANRLGLAEPPRQLLSTKVGQGKRCLNRRIRAAGYCFKYKSYRQGYADLIASGNCFGHL